VFLMNVVALNFGTHKQNNVNHVYQVVKSAIMLRYVNHVFIHQIVNQGKQLIIKPKNVLNVLITAWNV